MEDFVEKRLDGFLAFIDRDLETIKDMVDSVRMNGGTPEKICIPSCKLFGLPIEFYDGGSVTVMATPTDQKDE